MKAAIEDLDEKLKDRKTFQPSLESLETHCYGLKVKCLLSSQQSTMRRAVMGILTRPPILWLEGSNLLSEMLVVVKPRWIPLKILI